MMILLITVVTLSVIFMPRDAVSVDPANESLIKSITLPVISTDLEQGAGKDKVAAYCSICHSPDYITMQPKFPADKWSAIVHKMIVVFGAPVREDDSKVIINYLAEHYGAEK